MRIGGVASRANIKGLKKWVVAYAKGRGLVAYREGVWSVEGAWLENSGRCLQSQYKGLGKGAWLSASWRRGVA